MILERDFSEVISPYISVETEFDTENLFVIPSFSSCKEDIIKNNVEIQMCIAMDIDSEITVLECFRKKVYQVKNLSISLNFCLIKYF